MCVSEAWHFNCASNQMRGQAARKVGEWRGVRGSSTDRYHGEPLLSKPPRSQLLICSVVGLLKRRLYMDMRIYLSFPNVLFSFFTNLLFLFVGYRSFFLCSLFISFSFLSMFWCISIFQPFIIIIFSFKTEWLNHCEAYGARRPNRHFLHLQ